MDDHIKKCQACNGRGYFHCDCWPGDCICGLDYEDCEECRGEGWIDTSLEEPDWDEALRRAHP